MSSPAREPEPPGPRSRAETQLARSLAVGSRILAAGGHDDLNQGQISGRSPGRSVFLIKAALRGFGEATPTDMVSARCDPSAPRPADAPPELPLHQAIYQARPDVNAIVHSHAEWTLVFGALDTQPLVPISHEGSWFAGRLGRYTATSQTVLDLDVAAGIAAALGPGVGVLLANHGAVVVGRTVREAVIGAGLLERACRLQLRALSTGLPFRVSAADDIPVKRSFIYSATAFRSYWDFCVRHVTAASAEVRSWS
jgi:L-fuculose-phosphate aldolase